VVQHQRQPKDYTTRGGSTCVDWHKKSVWFCWVSFNHYFFARLFFFLFPCDVAQRCRRQFCLASSNLADVFFRNICCGLVADTLLHSDLLVKFSSGIINIIILLLLLLSSRFMFYSWCLVFHSRFDYLTYNLLLFSFTFLERQHQRMLFFFASSDPNSHG
jgi:hypothetical protein